MTCLLFAGKLTNQSLSYQLHLQIEFKPFSGGSILHNYLAINQLHPRQSTGKPQNPPAYLSSGLPFSITLEMKGVWYR